MNALTRAWATLKSLTMRWTRAQSFGITWLAGTRYDYQSAAGDGRTNAAVMACIRFVQRALTEAPLTVYQRNGEGELDPVATHPLQALLERPNPHYGGLHLLGALVADLMLTGNAYILKVRGGTTRPVQLWWVPSTMIEPRWPDDGSAFISHYEYAVDGRISDIAIDDVIHIRSLMPDPRNIRKGLSDLEALFREIATDNEAAQMSATLLRNQAVPGVILSPSDKDASPTQAQLEGIKAKFKEKFGGDSRGEPMVMDGPTTVSVLSWSPEQMNLRSLRQIPEERITAVYGLPAAVIGLGTGLEQTKVGATMDQQRQQAYDSCLLPLHRHVADELQMQLVPDFGDPGKIRVRFDVSEVGILQDDQNALHERARANLLAGLLTLNQALQMIGEEPVDGESGDVRYIPNTVTVKTLDTLIPEEQPALEAPTPLRALPAPQDEAAATRASSPPSVKTADFSDDALLARFEAGLSTLAEDLADDLLGEFEALVDTVAGRALSRLKAADVKADGDAIDGLVTVADHDQIKRLLRSYTLKGMRQAAQDLAPLTDGPVRIQRNNPEVRRAIADMEARLPRMVETTAADFGRLIRRLERRPGSVPLDEVRSALLAYIEESYPSRAMMIARTELSSAHARGVILVAEKSGIASRVHISDGDGDGPCKERNGTTATLEEARGIGLLHPHCALRLIPILAA